MINPDARDAALAPWLTRANGLIDDRVADAARHAGASDLTTAGSRLRELSESLRGLLRQARRGFYRDAIAGHRRGFDPAVHRELHHDPEAELLAGRTAPILGRDQFDDLTRLVRDASDDLGLMYAAYGAADVEHRSSRGIATGSWSTDQAGRLRAWMHGALSDAQVAIESAVVHLGIKSEVRG